MIDLPATGVIIRAAIVVAAALAAAGCHQTPTASSPVATATATATNVDINCPNHIVYPNENPDCYFLYMIKTSDPEVYRMGSQEDLIGNAHMVCRYMLSDNGADPVVDIGIRFARDNPNISQRGAMLFVAHAATAYCPQVVRH